MFLLQFAGDIKLIAISVVVSFSPVILYIMNWCNLGEF